MSALFLESACQVSDDMTSVCRGRDENFGPQRRNSRQERQKKRNTSFSHRCRYYNETEPGAQRFPGSVLSALSVLSVGMNARADKTDSADNTDERVCQKHKQ